MVVWLKTALQLSKKTKMITVQVGMIDLALKMILLVKLDISSSVNVMFQIKIGIRRYVLTMQAFCLVKEAGGIKVSHFRIMVSGGLNFHSVNSIVDRFFLDLNVS